LIHRSRLILTSQYNYPSFNYTLPKEKIADRPVKPYDSAKLLALRRSTKEIKEDIFKNLTAYLKPSDVLIFNNTKVNKARLIGKIKDREKEAEFLILKKISEGIYDCLARPIKNLKAGKEVVISPLLSGLIIEKVSEQILRVAFISKEKSPYELIEEFSLMPIPPYIRGGRADSADIEDYQSIFAKTPGSIAAPTASLHFTQELLEEIKNKGVQNEFVTLHIGMASVRPLFDSNDSQTMRSPEEEFFIFDKELKKRIISYKSSGRRIVAVGTTVVRALESFFIEETYADVTELIPTSLFIKPGFEFKAVDALITNFHFPGSSHLMLVEALLGRELLESSYSYALSHDFRFLSYGDAMFIE
jgi:S-adenosylmethionine:tRNA ribosyltransferase-isomerase